MKKFLILASMLFSTVSYCEQIWHLTFVVGASGEASQVWPENRGKQCAKYDSFWNKSPNFSIKDAADDFYYEVRSGNCTDIKSLGGDGRSSIFLRSICPAGNGRISAYFIDKNLCNMELGKIQKRVFH